MENFGFVTSSLNWHSLVCIGFDIFGKMSKWFGTEVYMALAMKKLPNTFFNNLVDFQPFFF